MKKLFAVCCQQYIKCFICLHNPKQAPLLLIKHRSLLLYINFLILTEAVSKWCGKQNE